MKQKIYLILLIFSSLINAQEYIDKGTTVVCIGRNDTIWIGVDSKISSTNSNIKKPPRCKILKSDKFVFAHSGLFTDHFTNLDIDTLFINCIRGRENINRIIDLFNYSLIQTLNYLGSLHLARRYYAVGDTIKNLGTGIIIASRENGKVSAYNMEFVTIVKDTSLFINRKSSVETKVYISKYFNAEPHKFSYFVSGYCNIIRPMVPLYRKWEISTAINHLISIEKNTYPDLVGDPINIIRITKNKIDWIQKSNLCN